MVPESLLWFLQEQAGAGDLLELRVERPGDGDIPKALEALPTLAAVEGEQIRLGAAALRRRVTEPQELTFLVDPREWSAGNAELLLRFMAGLGDLLGKAVVLGGPAPLPEALRYNPRLKGFRSRPAPS